MHQVQPFPWSLAAEKALINMSLAEEKSDNDKVSKQDETVSRNLFSWVNYTQLCKLLGLK